MALQDLYDDGRFNEAYDQGFAEFGAIQKWPNRVLAGRLAHNLGSRRTSRALLLKAGRAEPDVLSTQFYSGFVLLERLGPWETFRWMEGRQSLFEAGSETDKSDWLGLKSLVYSSFRDFTTAHETLDKARELNPNELWLASCRGQVLVAQDRREDALKVVSEALESKPQNRSMTSFKADILESLNRRDESLELLQNYQKRRDSCIVTAHIASLLVELKDYEAAIERIERFRSEARLTDKGVDAWVNANLFRCYYELGEIEKSKEFLGEHPSPAHRTLLENLRASSDTALVKTLEVENVRQNHVTCGPATLTILAQYWGQPADQTEIADEICYDGTSHLAQRRWADERDWITREFRVTWDATVALIDRGIPFILTTVAADSAHVQVVSGYDGRLRTLHITDPSHLSTVEMLADKGIEKYAFSGPRGLLLLPKDKVSLLDDVELPDSELYDLAFGVAEQLESDNRPRAEIAYRELSKAAPKHLLRVLSEYALASYDQDFLRMLEVHRELATLYPKAQRYLLKQQSCLARLGRHTERIELLEEVAKEPNCAPIFMGFLALELMVDASQWKRAEKLLRKAIHQQPSQALVHSWLGELLWKQNRGEEALQIRRFASCLEDKDEALAQEYFLASLPLGKANQAMEFLEERHELLTQNRSAAGRTLAWALEQRGRLREAHELLDELLERFPEDSPLTLFAADRAARFGDFEKAEELLEKSRFNTSEALLLESTARFHQYRGDFQSSLQYWQMLVKRDPTDISAQASLVSVLSTLGRTKEAMINTGELVERYPHNLPFQKLHYGLVVRSEPEKGKELLKKILSVRSNDSWAWGKLALVAPEEGEEALKKFAELRPGTTEYYEYKAEWERKVGNLKAARQACRDGLSSDLLEGRDLIITLAELCADSAQAREELNFVWGLIEKRAVHLGPTLPLFQAVAAPYFEPDELLQRLLEFNEGRHLMPEDLLAVVAQGLRAGPPERALEIAQESVERFPFELSLRVYLGDCFAAVKDEVARKKCLEHALTLDPTSNLVLRRLSDLLRSEGKLQEAADMLKRAAAADPADHFTQGFLAEILWMLEEAEGAIAHLQRALRLDPTYRWGWERLEAWGGPEAGLNLAKALCQERPSDSGSWLNLFGALPPRAMDERLAALEKARELAPLEEQSHLARVTYLAAIGRFEEALEACAPPEFGDRVPVSLRYRACVTRHHMGEEERAVSELRELLKTEPRFTQGLTQLCAWLDQETQKDELLQVVERLVDLEPEDPGNHALLGWALALHEKDPRDAFRRAVELEPWNEESIYTLLNSSADREDNIQFKADLEAFGGSLKPSVRLLFEMEAYLIDGELGAASIRFEQICSDEDAPDEAIRDSLNILVEKGHSDLALAALRRVGQNGGKHLLAGILCGRLIHENEGDAALEQALKTARDGYPFTFGLLGEFVGKMKAVQFKKYYKRNKDLLNSHTYPWAMSTLTMLEEGTHKDKEVVSWTDSWRERDGLEAWMLFNRSVSLRNLGRGDEAHELDRWAEENLEPDYNYYNLQICLAFDFATRGDNAQAQLRFLSLDPELNLSPYYSMIRFLLEGWLLADAGEAAAARAKVNEAAKVLDGLNWDSWLKTAHKKTVNHVTSVSSGFSAKTWQIGQFIRRNQNDVVLVACGVAGAVLAALR